LRDKKFLIVKEDKLLILPILMPSSDEQTYHLKLEIQKP
jgi:hypothetical protein